MFHYHQRIRVGAVAGAGTPLVAGLFVVGGSETNGSDGWSFDLVAIAVWFVLAGLLAYALASLLFLHDHQSDAIAAQLVGEGDGRALVARWLHRTRFYRNLFGLAGLITWVSSWSNGANVSTLLAFGLGGILLGGIASEAHQLRPTVQPRIAIPPPRGVDAYLMQRDERRSLVLAAVWFAVAAAAIVLGAAPSVLALVSLALVTISSVRLVQTRVASRPRPALEPGLERADDLIRELAITRSLAQPANAFACALLLPALQVLSGTAMGQLADVIGIVATVTAIWWWAQNKRLGLDWLLDQPREQTLAGAGR